MSRILIAVVDDDEAVRLSACMLLQTAGFDVVLFKSGEEFLARRVSSPIACILLDLQMPNTNGLQVLQILRSRFSSVPVIVITAHGAILSAVEAMKLGACDFIEKPYGAAELLAAIERALALGKKASEASIVRDRAAALVGGLNARERQVLQGIMGGRQNKMIAHHLGLSVRTVEAYRSQLLDKLGVKGTADAVRLGLAAGLGEKG